MRLLLLFISLLGYNISYAQGFKVIEVKEIVSGSEAFNAPVDSNGNSCGLVKVHSMMQDLTFDGNVVGDVAFENNEYKVFLGKGSQQLTIKRPHVLPVMVYFLDYGIEGIASKATYAIMLKEVALNTKKNQLHVDVKPASSRIYINDLLIDNESDDGSYNMILPKGDYICKVEASGYRTHASTLKIGKEPQVLHVELESLLADLEVNSQTSGTEIVINGEKKANGSWRGKLPAGTYTIVAQLDGFVPVEKVVQLAEKDCCTISIPALKRAKGGVVITTSLRDANIYIDGEQKGTYKCSENLQTGTHYLMVKFPFGYKDEERQFEVCSGSIDTIHVEMKPLNEMYAKAFAGDVNTQVEICHQKIESSKYLSNDTIERNYWYERIYQNFDKLTNAELRKIVYDEYERLRGLYIYYINDHPKALKILYRLVENDDGEDIYLELMYKNLKLGKYEEAISWGIKWMLHSVYEPRFRDEVIEACLKLNDVNKGVNIILGIVDEKWSKDTKSEVYEGIGDIYKKAGNCEKAVLYYKKSIQLDNELNIRGGEQKKKIKECGYTP